MVKEVLLVATGGAVGSAMRYLVGKVAGQLFTGSFPLGTFIANIVGCFVIGVLTGLVSSNVVSPQMKLLLVTGFCGGFTTFSSFANESISLMSGGQIALAILYIALSVAIGLFATFVGIKVVS